MAAFPSCLICGSTTFENVRQYSSPDIYELKAGVEPDGYRRSWDRCAECGFHASHYSRDPKILDRLYTRAYRDSSVPWRSGTTEETFRRVIALPEDQSETTVRVRWIKEAVNDMIRSGIVDWPEQPLRMLDVGGATGVFAYAFQDSQWKSHVIDPAEDGRFIETSLGIPYFETYYRPELFTQPFHLISLVFVLEHLLSPQTVLQQLRADLVRDGLVYIEVPDYIAFRLKPPEDDIFNSCHLWMFDPKSLLRLLQDAGFETMAVRRSQTLRGHYALTVLASPSRD